MLSTTGQRVSRVPSVFKMLIPPWVPMLNDPKKELKNSQSMAATILAGILLFFVLEKLVLWRHCHQEQCEAHDPPSAVTHDQGRSGLMIMGLLRRRLR